MSSEVGRRERRARPLVLGVYIGLPALFFVIVSLIDVAEEGAFRYEVLLVPGAMFLVGLFTLRRQRHRPFAWPKAGVAYGAVTGGIGAFYTIVLDMDGLATAFLLAALAGAGAGWLLGAAARRAISDPPVAVLADTPYELVYGVRGARKMRVRIAVDAVAVEETIGISEGRTVTQGPILPLGSLSHVEHVHLDDQLPAALPWSFRNTPRPVPGPALSFRTSRGEWRIPVDHAEPLAVIIRGRIAAAQPDRSQAAG